MDYGKVINQGLSAVWRHKALWLLGCLGVVLGGLGSGFNSVFQIRWQLDLQRDMLRLLETEGPMTPQQFEQFWRALLGSMAGLFAVIGLLLLLGFLGYLVGLVTRGAIID